MASKRSLLHAAFLLSLPIIVAWFGLSVWAAIALVLLALLWRWGLSIGTILFPAKEPAIVLDTISASHFVEKVRWSMDRAGIDYTERPSGGTLGAFYGGRTVPRLRFRTGAVRSQIGNSREILRYLWGAYAADEAYDVTHLEPSPERAELEQRCDRYGENLQVWVYHHILPHREITLMLWGADSPTVPFWQRQVLRLVYPIQRFLITRSFRITDARYAKVTEHIENLLAEIDATLADGRASILGGDTLNYTDFAFAAMCGLWLQPPNYTGGKADFVATGRDLMPASMREDVERWSEKYPNVVQWVERLYEQER